MKTPRRIETPWWRNQRFVSGKRWHSCLNWLMFSDHGVGIDPKPHVDCHVERKKWRNSWARLQSALWRRVQCQRVHHRRQCFSSWPKDVRGAPYPPARANQSRASARWLQNILDVQHSSWHTCHRVSSSDRAMKAASIGNVAGYVNKRRRLFEKLLCLEKDSLSAFADFINVVYKLIKKFSIFPNLVFVRLCSSVCYWNWGNFWKSGISFVCIFKRFIRRFVEKFIQLCVRANKADLSLIIRRESAFRFLP